MTAESRRPIEVFFSKRRASTANSTGFDYSTGYRVEEDILSRIRSLLLSRNGYRPPRTPYHSDEDHRRCSEHCYTTDTTDLFDFSTAKSVRLLTRTESGGLAFPETPHLRSRGATLRMDGGRRTPQSSIPVPERSLRATSSTNDLSASLDDAALHAALLPCCPPCPPEGTKKTFRLPRLILKEQTAKKKRDPNFRSCIDFTPLEVSAEFDTPKKPDSPCCPPTSAVKLPSQVESTRRLSGKTVKADAGDLACFLAGCGPGECKTHSRRSSQPVSPRATASIKPIDKVVADDFAKLGLTVKTVNQASGSIGHSRSGSRDTSRSVIRHRPDESETKQKDVLKPFSAAKSSRSSVSLDAFPHAVQSLEMAAKEAANEALSSVVVTNFSLPGPKAKPKDAEEPNFIDASAPRASESVRFKSPVASLSRIVETGVAEPSDGFVGLATSSIVPKKSNASLRSNTYSSSNYSPSIRSVSSKAASIRHVLLKPSTPDSGPVDIALPIPPVLTQFAVSSLEIPVSQNADPRRNKVDVLGATESKDFVVDEGPLKQVVHLTSLEKAKDLANRIKTRSDAAEWSDKVVRDGSSATTIQYPAKALEPTTLDHGPEPVVEISSKSVTSLKGLLGVSDTAQLPTKGQEPTMLDELPSVDPVSKSSTLQKGLSWSPNSTQHATKQPEYVNLDDLSSIKTPSKSTISEGPPIGSVQNHTKESEAAKSDELLGVEVSRSSTIPKGLFRELSSAQQALNGLEPARSDYVAEPAATTPTKSMTSLQGLLENSSSGNQPLQISQPEDSTTPACCADPARIANQNPPEAVAGKAACCSGFGLESARFISPDSTNAVYWGFVPAVKEAVHDAVQIAVKRAVEDIIVPPGSQKNDASDAYRKLVGDSLAEAAKDADKYLRRASLWNEPPSSLREKSKGEFELPESIATDKTPLISVPIGDQSEVTFDSNPGIPTNSHPQMETIPLETVDENLIENHKQGRNASGTWNRIAKRQSSGYMAIPTRNSSKSRVLGTKNQSTPESSVKESSHGSRQAGLIPKRGPRSSSSVESLKSLNNRDNANDQDSTDRGLDNADADRSSSAKDSSIEKLGRRNTVHWLRDLLSTNGPYEPRFTALPPRSRRDENASTGRIRSQTVPSNPVKSLYLGATPIPLTSKLDGKDTEDAKDANDLKVIVSVPENKTQHDSAMTEAFTKTINDLEFLLNEALFIARQAADKEDTGYGPTLLGRAAAVLKGGRKGFEDDIVRKRTLEARHQSRLRGRKRSDGNSSVASMHESLGSFTSSDSENSNTEGNGKEADPLRVQIPQLRLKTPTAELEQSDREVHNNKQSSTGRVPTPFPTSPIDSVGEGSQVNDSGLEDFISDQPSINIKDVNPFLANNAGNMRKISQVSPTKRKGSTLGRRSQQTASCAFDEAALAFHESKLPSGKVPVPPATPRGASLTKAGKRRATQTDPETIKASFPTDSVPSRQEVREYITAFHHPPIQARTSSLNLRKEAEEVQANSENIDYVAMGRSYSWQDVDRKAIEPCSQDERVTDPAQTGGLVKPITDQDRATSISKSYDGSQSEAIQFDTGFAHRQNAGGDRTNSGGRRETIELRDIPNANLPQVTQRGGKGSHPFNLQGRNHISLRGEHHKGFSFARTHKKPKIARDWAPARKRFVATVACISTALVGTLVGVYAAEVPAIQYWIVDFHHYTILGNVFFFLGLSIPTFFFWPLPLLHGRKPYTLGAMSLAMPLLFPQALAVGQFRSPYVDYWRVGLIMPRALMGLVLGFANMNFKATLLDLFGASLQSENPHQEVVDENDVRRHGGGLGVWLGIWTWCAMGSIGIGFLIGAVIINHANPAWGFYISIAIIAFVLLLNVICPEVRRSAFRRSVAELKHEEGVSRRLGRGEVKMHMVHTGPKWWGEEFHYGVKMNAKMLRQPGFMVMAVYVSWIYGQIVLLVVLLGSLVSNSYKFTSPLVGASVMAVPTGAFLAIPFQKAGLFSRSRGKAELEDDNAETLNQKVTLSSHLVRRAIFILVLPFAGLGYTLSSNGPPIPYIVPILFAGLIGFLSNLAMGECHGIIMETFDTSDLQPGMTGRPRSASGDKTAAKRTNYSSFPRVSSGFAITQGIGYVFAAVATGVGGVATRNIGQQAATGIMAGILLVLSLLLLGVLYRFRDVQIIPNSKQDDMQKWKNARRTSAILRAEGIDSPDEWRPIIIGNPTHTMRRMCLLEMGRMTRWSEIRRKNHLVDENTLESKHPNLAVIRDVEQRIKAAEEEIIHNVRRSISRHSLSRNSSRRSKRSDQDQGDLGGHREMISPLRSGNGSRKRERGKSRIDE